MTKNLRRVATGACVGLAICYVCLVLPRGENTKASPRQVPELDQIIMTITADGSIFLAGERIELSRLETRLKELTAQGRPITIRADKSAPFKRIVEVMDSVKAASKSPDSVGPEHLDHASSAS